MLGFAPPPAKPRAATRAGGLCRDFRAEIREASRIRSPQNGDIPFKTKHKKTGSQPPESVERLFEMKSLLF